MFAYCGNNPVNRKDTEGTFAGLIIGGVVGAITGALSAKASGQSPLFGAVIGGLAGIASGTVGLFVAAISHAGAAALVSAAANTVISAASNLFNQYVNYRLQDKARREDTGCGSAVAGQNQAEANKAYKAASFGAYFKENIGSFATATVSGFVGGALGGWAACGGSQTVSFEFPRGSAFQDMSWNTGISFGTNMMQILLEPPANKLIGLFKGANS